MLLYEVAVWTSGKVETMSHAMHTIFGQHEESLLFYWTQKECTRVNFHSPSEEEAPDRASELCVEGEIKKKSKRKDYSANMFKKDLTKVWEKYPQYNQHNTVDHSLPFFPS